MYRLAILRLLVAFAVGAVGLLAQWPPASWAEPMPPVQITDNLYYVGSEGLAVYLITTPDGHFLINTGLENSTDLIHENIAATGHELEDVKVLLTMQAHYDHCAALAEIKDLTGAQLYATEGDRPVLEDGGRSDYHLGEEGHFPPVRVDRTIEHGEELRLGGVILTVHVHPGHTQGSASYGFQSQAAGKQYSVLLVNMGSVNPGVALRNNAKYPEISRDYRLTFQRQKALSPDIWLAAHPSQCNLHEKRQRADAGSAGAFVDPEGYQTAVERHERLFLVAYQKDAAVDAQ